MIYKLNDMQDLQSLKVGKFKKRIEEFSLEHSIDEVIQMMALKSD